MLVVQANPFNRSRIQTIIVAAITRNVNLAGPPGNVTLPAPPSGLAPHPVFNVSQLLTTDRAVLMRHMATLPVLLQAAVDAGLRMVLEL